MKSVRKAPITTVQPEQLPALGIFVLSERDLPDGNTSIAQFVTHLEIGISWVAMSSDSLILDGTLDQFVAQSKIALLSDATFLQLFEYVEEISREMSYSKEGESYICENRMRLKVSYRTDYPPFAPYDLTLIDIKTKEPAGTAVLEVQISETPTGLPSQNDPIVD